MAGVYIYRNLHKSLNSHCYSLKQRNKVFAHSENIAVTHASFKVSEIGRQRVIETRRKNVHAFVVCDETLFAINDDAIEYENKWNKDFGIPVKIRYNPYVSSNFLYENGDIVHKADRLLLTPQGIYSYE